MIMFKTKFNVNMLNNGVNLPSNFMKSNLAYKGSIKMVLLIKRNRVENV